MSIKKGYTLLEVLSALLILTIGFAGILHFFTYSRQLSSLNEEKKQVSHILEHHASLLEQKSSSLLKDFELELKIKDQTWLLIADILDTTDIEEVRDRLAWSTSQENILLSKPKEVLLQLYNSPEKTKLMGELHFLTGGLIYVP